MQAEFQISPAKELKKNKTAAAAMQLTNWNTIPKTATWPMRLPPLPFDSIQAFFHELIVKQSDALAVQSCALVLRKRKFHVVNELFKGGFAHSRSAVNPLPSDLQIEILFGGFQKGAVH